MFESRDESGSNILPQNEQEDGFCVTRLAGEVDTGSGDGGQRTLGARRRQVEMSNEYIAQGTQGKGLL